MAGFEDGHFYSPVPDLEDLRRRRERIWRPEVEVPGVELAVDRQRSVLDSVRPFAANFDYPETVDESAPATAFYDDNGLFAGLDSRMHFCLLRKLAPRRVVEVGSGFSSLLAADVNRRYFAGEMEITCIEPYPRPFLDEDLPGIDQVIEARVEEVGPGPFRRLGRGDLLFIDSSHVSKTGSDVNFLVLETLPRLAPGVVIHFHDIFFPREYPQVWVLDDRRFWNEQYLVHALLMFSSAFEILFGCAAASYLFPELVESVFGARCTGSSLWIEKTA